MRLKLIVVLVNDEITDTVIDAARAGGATGATTITSVRGEGLKPEKTFFGLDLAAQRNVVLFLVVEPRARDILERIRDAGKFDENPGAGVAFQVPIDDAVGLSTQLPAIMEELESEL
ncbi:MAG: P-II family nitrogen regulator [Rhodospirillales bacterium]|nr:P-II family nitrogen regulator [Rhodospirillales bacterium]